MNGKPAAPAVAVAGLRRDYGDRHALNNVSFELAAGATLTVFGANGAGKTTLLRVLAGLLRPHAGDVSVLGNDLPRNGYALRGMVGMVSHDPMLYRDLSVRENIQFSARLNGVPDAQVDEMVAAVKLENRAGDTVKTLSKGMIQRAAVGRALIGKPPLLLLDEPRANLDPMAAELLEPLIGRSAGRTRVIVTHDPEFGLAEADKVIGLRDGEVVIAGNAGEFDESSVKELYR